MSQVARLKIDPAAQARAEALTKEAFERLVNAPASARSPGQVPTGRFPLPAAPAPSGPAKVTGVLLTLAVWGGLAYLVVKAARGIKGK